MVLTGLGALASEGEVFAYELVPLPNADGTMPDVTSGSSRMPPLLGPNGMLQVCVTGRGRGRPQG